MKEDEERLYFLSTLKPVLAELPFTTIYSTAHVMFDTENELEPFDKSLEDTVKFLKETKLQDISFEDIDDLAYFTIKNKQNGRSIKASNRRVVRNEFRANVLRDFLMRKKRDMPEANLYDVLSEAVKSPRFSQIVLAAKNVQLSLQVSRRPMLPQQFDLFVRAGFQLIQRAISEAYLPNDLTPKKIRNDDALQEKLWRELPMEMLYDVTWELREIPEVRELWDTLQEIAKKRDQLLKEGCIEEFYILDDFLEEAHEAFFLFLKTGDADEYRRMLRNASLEVEYSVVGKHRGLFTQSTIYKEITKLIGKIFGLFGKTTDSIAKIRAAWIAAKNLTSHFESKPKDH